MVVLTAALTVALALAPQSAGGTQSRRTQGADRQPGATQPRRTTSQQIGELETSVRVLEAELRSLRREMGRSNEAAVSAADMQRLILLEQREERLESRLDLSRNRLRNAQARETDIQRRLDNIDTERIAYGGLNREDSERAVRNYLDREMARTREEVLSAEREVTRVETELESARLASDALRRKLRLTAEDIEGETATDDTAAADDEEEIIDPGDPAPDEDTTLDPVPQRTTPTPPR